MTGVSNVLARLRANGTPDQMVIDTRGNVRHRDGRRPEAKLHYPTTALIGPWGLGDTNGERSERAYLSYAPSLTRARITGLPTSGSASEPMPADQMVIDARGKRRHRTTVPDAETAFSYRSSHRAVGPRRYNGERRRTGVS